MSQRVVVIERDGKSTINPDTEQPRVLNFEHTPGFAFSTLWETEPAARPAQPSEDPALTLRSFHPRPGGTVLMTMTVPPDEVYFSEDFNPALAGAEFAASTPGLAERMELDAPGFHRTDTVDYVIVLDGQIVLVADEGEAVLEKGDVVIQNATRHAWQNRSGKPATLAVVLIGAHL